LHAFGLFLNLLAIQQAQRAATRRERLYSEAQLLGVVRHA
jgi:hypothetical protein